MVICNRKNVMYDVVVVVVWNYQYQNSNVTILLVWHIDRQTFDDVMWPFLDIVDFEHFRFRLFNHSGEAQTLIY